MRTLRQIILVSSLVFSASAAAAELDSALAEQIAAAGRRTIARQGNDPFAYKAILEQSNGNLVEVEFLTSPTAGRTTVSQVTGDDRKTWLDILQQGGQWYVKEFDETYRCRPYEAPLMVPIMYRLIEKAELRYITEAEDLQRFGDVESIEGELVHFRVPLSSEEQSQNRRIVAELEKLLDSAAPEEEGPDARERLKQRLQLFNHVLKSGVRVTINAAHGYIAEYDFPGRRVAVEDFVWLEETPEVLFEDRPDADWPDRSSPLLIDGDNKEDVVMIAHAPMWRPGRSSGDPDVHLLDTVTGQLRRIPYQHGVCMPGSFSSDRTRVYVSGIASPASTGTLVEVDLISGENREFEVDEIHGLPMLPTLAPDGRTLAVCDLAPGRYAAGDEGDDGLLKTQILLIDVESGHTQPLGEPMRVTSQCWLPDGNGLLVGGEKAGSHDDETEKVILRIDRTGGVETLRPGEFPHIVANGERILFHDHADDLWYTCRLDGTDPVRLGDGLQRFFFASASPDGKQIVMMYFGEADTKGPRPYVVNAGSGKATPIPVGDGLWAMPVWK